MNECDRTRRVGAYHDGELTAVEGERLESHLGGCPPCRAELRAVTEVSALLRTTAAAEAPAGLLERLHAAVAALRDRLIRRFAYRVAAVAAAVLIACTVWLWRADATETASTRAWEWERIALGSGETRPREPIDQLTFLITQDLAENDRDVR